MHKNFSLLQTLFKFGFNSPTAIRHGETERISKMISKFKGENNY